MKYFLAIFAVVFSFSCQYHKDVYVYKTDISRNVYNSQLKYLDLTIEQYARILKEGEYYFNENTYLDQITNEFRSKIKGGEQITESEKKSFFDHFEKTFKSNPIVDFENLNQIRNLSISNISDIDLLKLYVKNNFVAILLNNKMLPYNSWSIMASAKEWSIKKGQPFEIRLANTAWDSRNPNEWYVAKYNKNSLTEFEIFDTLHQDREGVVNFSTENYKIGKNKLIFISKMTATKNDHRLARTVEFYVK